MRPSPSSARSTAAMQRRCDDFNADHPAGTVVFYHPVIGEPECQMLKVRGDAYVLSGHTPVVFLEGKAGCVALDALTNTCPHVRLNEDGICRTCGADRRGI